MSENRNLASKYAKSVDERFTKESQAVLALNNNVSFTGVRTVNVYSIPTVPMTDYNRSGDHRYGDAGDLGRTVQTMTLERDRAFTFIIDKGDKTQSMMVMDAGRALRRQMEEVWVPEFDTYVFRKLASEATERGNYSTEAITKENAYEQFLLAMEHMGDRSVPDKGRVAFCSYRFANLLKQDPAFIKCGEASQEMLKKGIIGEVDGCRIVKVPSSRLPAGCAFLLTHPSAAVGPKQLEDYKTHADPPGISGWLVEGRVIYDCFVLDEKADGIFYHGAQEVMRQLNVTAIKTGESEAMVLLNPGTPENGCQWYYEVCGAAQAVVYGENVSEWPVLSASGGTVRAEPDEVITVVEARNGQARAVGHAGI